MVLLTLKKPKIKDKLGVEKFAKKTPVNLKQPFPELKEKFKKS